MLICCCDKLYDKYHNISEILIDNQWIKYGLSESSSAMNKSLVPAHLINDIVANNSVLFMGAGTGAPDLPSGPQLAKELLEMAGYAGELLPLDEASQYYCQHCDGGQQRRLMRFLKRRLLLCRHPTEAQLSISSIPYFKNVVTTNYDLLLNRCLNVVPLVEDNDLSYWDENERHLIKLHGCIAQPDTIVVTKENYARFLAHRLNGLLCQQVRTLMATKTVLFIGYSLDDYNFRVINEQIRAGVQLLQGQLDKVHAPVGLEIYAQTPEEIVVSILAEIIEVRRSRLPDNR